MSSWLRLCHRRRILRPSGATLSVTTTAHASSAVAAKQPGAVAPRRGDGGQHTPKRVPGRYPSMRAPMTIDADLKGHLSHHRSADLAPYRPELLPPDLVKVAARLDDDSNAKLLFGLCVGIYAVFIIVGFPCFMRLLYYELSKVTPAVEEPTRAMKYLYRPELVEVSGDLMWMVNENM